MAETQDLWPDFEMKKITSPKTILAEQAIFLNEKTKNVISAKVETDTSQDGTSFIQNFMLYVPVLNNYSYELFYVTHDVTLYPVRVFFDGGMREVLNESEFVEALKDLFGAPKIQKLIQSLYSQAVE